MIPRPDVSREQGRFGSRSPRDSLVPMALVFYAGVLALAVGWSVASGDALLFASSEERIHPLRDLTCGLLAGLAVIWVSWELTERTRWGSVLADQLAQALGARSLRDCALLALASGVAEEALFRGALQPRLGLVASSLVFGLAHFVPRRGLWPWALFAIATGILLGLLFEWTGNLIAPVTAHASINAVNLWLLASRSRVSGTRDQESSSDGSSSSRSSSTRIR